MAAKVEPLLFLQDLPPAIHVSVPKFLPAVTARAGGSGGASSVPQLVRHCGGHGEHGTGAGGARKLLPKHWGPSRNVLVGEDFQRKNVILGEDF